MPTVSPSPSKPDVAPWAERVRAVLAERGLSPDDVVIPEGETPEDVQARRAIQASNRASRWRSRLPIMYAEASLDDLDPTTQHAGALRHWLNSGQATLILAGSVGTGKTHAAYALLNEAVAQGVWAVACTVYDLERGYWPDGDRDLVHQARECDLLLLDDLGATKASDAAVANLTALLDARLNAGRRQVITTNSKGADLVEAWGGRAMDRLRYKRLAVEFVGPSRRADW